MKTKRNALCFFREISYSQHVKIMTMMTTTATMMHVATGKYDRTPMIENDKNKFRRIGAISRKVLYSGSEIKRCLFVLKFECIPSVRLKR